MSINFPTDSSVQGTYTSFPYTITNNDGYVSSNYVNLLSTNNSNYTMNASNILKSFIDTTNTNLTATNTNLANNYYNRTSTDTLLAAKQPNLTSATTLLGTGGNITGIDYNKITTNPLSFTTPLSKSVANVVSIDLSSYATNSSLTTTQTNNSNYTKDASNILQTNINTTNTNLTATNTNITNNYYNKTSTDTLLNAKEQILTFLSPLTRTTNTISINLGSYSTTGTDPNFLKLIGGTMTGLLTGTTINATIALQEAGANLTSKYLRLDGTNTMTGNLSTTGTITGTTFSGSGANLNNIPYTALTGTVPFYTKTETDTLLTTTRTNNSNYAFNISNILNTNSSNYASNISNVLLINYNSLNTTTNTNLANNYYNKTSTDTLLNAKEQILTFSSPLIRTTNTISINLGSYSTTGTDPNFLKLIGGTLTGTLNGTIINASTNLQEAGTNLSSKYLLLSGGNITGNLGIGNPTPQGMLSIGRPDAVSDGTLTISKNNGTGGIRNFKMGYDTNFNFCFGDFGGAVSGNTWLSSQFLINYASGYVGIGTTNLISKLTIKCTYDVENDGICINAADTTNTYNMKIFSFVQAGSQVGYKFKVNNISSSVEALKFYYDGGVNISSYLNIKDKSIYNNLFNSSGFEHGTITDFNNITDFGYRYINASATNGPGTPSNPALQYYTWFIGLGANYPYTQFGAQFCLPRNIANPILSIRYRDNSAWGGWTGITAEALTAGNKTISGSLTVNDTIYFKNDVWQRGSDASQRIYFSTNGRTYYQGYGSLGTDYNHEWRNHVGTGVMFLSYYGSLLLSGEIVPTMTSVSSTNTDYCGVSFNSAFNGVYQTSIKILYGTFTGMHRCFTEDELYNKEEPQKFKDDYVGRIVISTGKIATDNKTENETEWEIKYDKEGITIEDALPIIELSRTKKDKRVFGVLGLPSRNNSRIERMIVNSIGEGAIYVINSNGNIENGDYIQSSDYLGFGEHQDEIFLANYTVAKATIDCNFELDSSYYNCYEIDDLDINGNKLRVAFIAATYHCG